MAECAVKNDVCFGAFLCEDIESGEVSTDGDDA